MVALLDGNDSYIGGTGAVASDRWAIELGERIAAARQRAHMTQQDLADAAQVSKVWVSKLERGLVARPGLRKLNQIAQVLGTDVVPSDPGSSLLHSKPNVVQVEPSRTEGGKLHPVYRWGAAGDPRDLEHAPDVDHEEHPPVGRESLVGAKGFAVEVRGESMSARGIHDGDKVWINPERPARYGRPVLARLWDDDEEMGMVVKTLSRDENGLETLTCEGNDGPNVVRGYTRFEVIGPVVGISRFLLPGG